MVRRLNDGKHITRDKGHHNPNQIKKWVEARRGKPSVVKGTEILRIDFPGYSGKYTLQEIPWDAFFRKFEERDLAFLYQEKTARGERSNFNKLVRRKTVEARSRTKKAVSCSIIRKD